jgi:hypothetical protein
VPELERSDASRRERVERGREALVVAAERRRQLPEERPELRRADERVDALEQQSQVRSVSAAA